jgi:hypothetical protein
MNLDGPVLPAALTAALAQCELRTRVLQQALHQALPRRFDVVAASVLDERQRPPGPVRRGVHLDHQAG